MIHSIFPFPSIYYPILSSQIRNLRYLCQILLSELKPQTKLNFNILWASWLSSPQ